MMTLRRQEGFIPLEARTLVLARDSRAPLTGFTLVETLVAITIMTLAIIAPFQAAQKVLTAASVSRDQLIAAALAQEGMEYVRFVRTNNYLVYTDHNDFVAHKLNGLNLCYGSTGKKCTVDPGSAAIAACGGGTCSPLLLNATTGRYSQTAGSGSTSLFTRSVHIDNFSTYEAVKVTVTWSNHGPHTITLIENLYDWF